MPEYKLLKHHMNPNPDYLFGHAEIAGLLASRKNELNDYAKYVLACEIRGIAYYSEECYNQFMIDCKRQNALQALERGE